MTALMSFELEVLGIDGLNKDESIRGSKCYLLHFTEVSATGNFPPRPCKKADVYGEAESPTTFMIA